VPAFGTRRAGDRQKGSATIHRRVGVALSLSVAAMMSSAAAAVAANAHINPSRGARAAANSRCRTSDFAMQCIRFTTSSANTGNGHDGAEPTHARRTHASNAYAYGIDFGWGAVNALTARSMGAQFAASYLSRDASKNWTLAMITAYHALDLGTVSVWETSATRALAGYGAGRTDALAALRQVRALELPPQLPVYFAVDFDETSRQAGRVASYFRGVKSVMGVSRTGAYGGYWTISRLFNAGLIGYGWQTSAWSRGLWDPRAQLQQYAYSKAYDWNRAMTNTYGASY
jgi:Domain of unknown function (DUF1906)